ncbi:MAG: Succinate dehydrogenase iron-sulfur protein, partial [uncultured Acidimicrobiales bacterium]
GQGPSRAQGQAVQPGDGQEAALAGVHGGGGGHRPRPRCSARGQVDPGRHPHLPPLVRPRRVRLRRHGAQRRQPAGLPRDHQGRRHQDHPRAHPGPAGDQGPRGGHGALLRAVPLGAAVPDQHQRPGLHRALPVGRGPGPLRRHDQVHPVCRLHDLVPDLLGQLAVRGPGSHRERPPLHLRQPRPGRRAAPRHPEPAVGRVEVPHRLQLLGSMPSRHQGDPGHRRGQAGHPVRPGL